MRQIGDYRELIELNQEQTQAVINSAEQFVDAVGIYLSIK